MARPSLRRLLKLYDIEVALFRWTYEDLVVRFSVNIEELSDEGEVQQVFPLEEFLWAVVNVVLNGGIVSSLTRI
jgi:hypothetical protein